MNQFVIPTLASRVMELYPKQFEQLRSAIVRGINTIPFVVDGDESYIKFAIQMHIPNDLWQVLLDLFNTKDWRLFKDTQINYVDRLYDINNISIGHTRVN